MDFDFILQTILMNFDFILQTILAVFLTFIILGVFLTFFVYKIHINYAREIKDTQRLREESQAHLEKAESLLKKATKLNEDSISTLNEAKNIQQADE